MVTAQYENFRGPKKDWGRLGDWTPDNFHPGAAASPLPRHLTIYSDKVYTVIKAELARDASEAKFQTRF